MRIIDNFEALENLAGNRKKILLLFSGGLDSCHTLSKLNSLNWEVTLLHIGLGEPLPNTIEVAKNMSFAYYHEDVVEEFCNNFLAKGIYCNATYYGGMPLSSTFTRPLIAKK
ncbi:argininosuccinate synthase domain-containing protein [Psychrobacter sp. H7-1]|uniref:argininosuccinate synthase domain-containing protein n=1 Tax=Psychrobacter sp. H7-1 TaxID=1569265 RepID=UPI00191AA408|nr:argininosuccinate synthase domain-containing protein [Psychrobacter sp. H7-1]